MHTTAYANAALFANTYVRPGNTILEIGSRDVNGSLRPFFPDCVYLGVDVEPGPNVDYVLSDPYRIPLPSESCDIILSTSAFEHTEFFWQTFLEIMRLLKPNGLFYLNAPSNGPVHRYPVDCWRFYPDAAEALVKWGRHKGFSCTLLESFTTAPSGDVWADFVAVFLRNEKHSSDHPSRMFPHLSSFHEHK